MKKYLLLSIVFASCNTYNNKMNDLLQNKKRIETLLDSNHVRDQRFRDLTGYNEIYDSISIGATYPHSELVDSIWNMKSENKILDDELKNTQYSIDSLQKLK